MLVVVPRCLVAALIGSHLIAAPALAQSDVTVESESGPTGPGPDGSGSASTAEMPADDAHAEQEAPPEDSVPMPEPAAAPAAPDVMPDGVKLEEQGRRCVVEDGWLPDEAQDRCRRVLLPRRLSVFVQTPGSFIIGVAFGSEGRALVFGPAVGVGVAVSIPLKSPTLEQLDRAGLQWKRPSEMSFVANWNFGVSGGVTGLNVEVDDPTVDSTHVGFAGIVFIGPEMGWAWYDDAQSERRATLSLGVMGAYLGDVEGLGQTWILGAQPSLQVSF